MTTTTTKLTIIAAALLLSTTAHAAGTAINETGEMPDASAILDARSENKGFLPPRMTEVQKNAIASPATGLMVYQIDGTTGLYVYDGTVWKQAGSSATGSVTSVTGTSPISVASGTTTPVISLGTVPVASGGTGLTSAGSDGQVLTSNGTNLFWNTPTIGISSDANNNTRGGTLALNGSDKGTGNTAFGYQAMQSINSGFENTAVGVRSLQAAGTGYANVGVGFEAGKNVTSSSQKNIAIGHTAGQGITSGQDNIAIGTFALNTSNSSSNNIAIGAAAGMGMTTSDNVGVGSNALASNTVGGQNVALGTNTMAYLKDGIGNVAIGHLAATSLWAWPATATFSNTTAIGASALTGVTTGTNNTAVGANALGAVSTSSGNVALGRNAGQYLVTGGNNVFLGDGAGVDGMGSYSLNRVAIGADALNDTDNSIVLGNSSHTKTVIKGIYGTTLTGTQTVVIDANGQLGSSATSGGSGTVTSVSGTSPISVATGTTTPVISLGTVPVASGGTGAIDAATARTNLGLGSAATVNTGTASGNVPLLDGGGKIQMDVLPISGLSYKGGKDLSANPTVTVEASGNYYIVSAAGAEAGSGIAFSVGDWMISNGTAWDKISNSTKVDSVAGKTGAVTLATSDLTDVDLTGNASGKVLAWSGTKWMPAAAGGAGTVTSVTGTSPISVATGTTTPVISLGTVPVASGGTGATTASAARTALSAASSGANSDITSLTGLTTVLSVAQGGTGTATGSITGTSALTFTAGGTNQNVTLTPSGTGFTLLGGNVAVGGTTSAADKLNIADTSTTASSSSLKITKNGAISGTGFGVSLTVSGATAYNYGANATVSGSGNTTNFGYRSYVSGALTNYGVYGVGTSGTTGNYGVYGEANGAAGNTYGGYFKNTATTTGSKYGLYVDNSGASTSASYGGFFTASNASGSAYALVTGNGNVGIGTTTPAYMLDVTGDINFTGTLRKSGAAFGTGTVTSVTGTTPITVATGTTTPVISLGTVGVANGGTGQTTYAVGDLLYASSTSALSRLADVAAGSALISGGVGVAPSWGTPAKATSLAGGNSTTLLGAIGYQNNIDTTTLLAPNTTATKKFLTQTGTGTNGAAPAWGTLSVSDIASGTLGVANGGTGAATLTGLLRGTGTTAITGGATVALASEVSGTLPVANGGTGTATAPTQGGVIYASSTSALASTAAGTSGYLLKSNGTSAPTWLATVPVANGGTGTTTGSITGTGALTFTAGGTNTDVTLTPNGTGSVVMNGYTQLGGTTAPAIKIAKFTGTTSSTTTAVIIPHTFGTKIISATGFFVYGTYYQAMNSSEPGYECYLYWTSSDIRVRASGAQTFSKAFTVTVMYEQ